jgi:hypothetical protein
MTIVRMALIIKDDMRYNVDTLSDNNFCRGISCWTCLFDNPKGKYGKNCYWRGANKQDLLNYLNQNYPERMI